MTHTLCRALALAIVAGWFAAGSLSLNANTPSQRAEFQALLTRYDRTSEGPAKARLAARIDSVAHQKYATVSRLYWHTDLASAVAAARERGRPILHLRLLGRLDEDLSCANSRLFRATLYANQEVSRFLRDHFELVWSSERPVPRVSIDYGDGRRLERTTAGNSAHYVLDQDGHLLDVLPGLYAPDIFRRELQVSLALAASVRNVSGEERARQLVEYHQQRILSARQDWNSLAGTPGIPPARQRLTTPAGRQGEFVSAMLTTGSKVALEARDIRRISPGLVPDVIPEQHIAMWTAAGQALLGIGDPQGATAGLAGLLAVGPVPGPRAEVRSRLLDEASRALVMRLHNDVPLEMRATGDDLDRMVARLEETIVADTALNHLRLRPQIAAEIVRRGGRIEFAALNAWIYTAVFHTPREDAWLGLLPRDVFTGVPGDGVVIRK